jgi:hypothetical protein
MTQLERRETYLRQIHGRAVKKAHMLMKTATKRPDLQATQRKLKKKKRPVVPIADSEALPYTTPEDHHHISHSQNFSDHVPSWLFEHNGDPATKVRRFKLL